MGRRSINTTKSGKYMNPTDQARKEARKRELKKNKKQRMMVRQAVLKGKDPYKLLEDMEQIDKMEYDPTQPPKLNEKVLKDKRKKLRETFDRVFRLYEKEDPSFAVEIRKAESEYNSKRSDMQAYYEQVRLAEQVQLDQIPLPDAPSIQPIPSQIPLPIDIPLGMPPPKAPSHGILKKPQSAKAPPLPPLSVLRKRKPPGPPPGPPTALSDDEEEKEAVLVPENTNVIEAPVPEIEKAPPAKQRKIRFEDDDKYDPEDPEKDTRPKYKPAVSPLQVRMLQMAGQVIPMVAVPEDKGLTAPGVPPVAEKMEVDQDEVDKLLEDIKAAQENPVPLSAPGTKAVSETISTPSSTPGGSATMPPGAPPGPPPGMPPGPPPGLPPMLFRPPPLRGAPPGAPPRMLPPGPPPGRPPGIPPGPPPGLPPNLRAPPPRLPSGPPGVPPPRLMRPPQVPPPGIHPPSVPTSAASNPNVLSAPPSIMKPPLKSDEDKKKGGATIEAKPQIKNPIGDVTRFMPTALRIKRNQQKGRSGKDDTASLKPSPAVAPQTKDDAYENFLKEMQGLL